MTQSYNIMIQLDLLLGIGIPAIVVFIKSGEALAIALSPTLLSNALGLLMGLMLTISYIPYRRFQFNKTYGISLLCIYFATMLLNVLIETFGPDF